MEEIIVKYRAEVDGFKAELEELKRKMGVLESESKKATKSMTSDFDKLAKVAGGLFAADKIKDFIGHLVSATAESQKFAAILTNALGSKSAGQKALADLSAFAAKTPFQLNELTESFIKLVNRGFKPTQAEMTKLGDLAASQGKSFDMLTEAILDAMTGEGERLKEFGIRMSQQGDKVSLSFKGMTHVVEKNDAAIRNAILSFGELQGVAGSMGAVSATVGGKLSNLADNADRAAKNMGNMLAPAINYVLDAAGGLLTAFNSLIESSTPLTDGLRGEQAEFNVLTDAITDANTPTEVRKLLIERLNSEFSEYLPNLITEKTSLDDIKKAQADVNIEFQKRIALTARQELLQANMDKQTKEIKKQADLLLTISKFKGLGNEGIREDAQKLLDLSKSKVTRLNEEYKELLDVTEQIALNAGVTTLELAGGTTQLQKQNEEGRKIKSSGSSLVDPKKREAELEKARKKQEENAKFEQDLFNEINQVAVDAAHIQEEERIKIEEDQKKRQEENAQFEKDLFQEIHDVEVDAAKVSIEEEKKKQDAIREERKKTFEASVAFANALFDLNAALLEREAQEIEQRQEAELEALDVKYGIKKEQETAYETERRLIQEKFAKEQAELKRKQAIADKAQAAYNIALSTAQGVIAALASVPPNVPLSVAIGIAGAIEAAAVLAKPIPEFAKGGKVRGGKQIIQVNEKGEEFVAKAEATRKYSKELEAMNSGRFEEYLTTHRVLPMLTKMHRVREQLNQKEKSDLKRVIKAQFDDTGLRHDIRKPTKLDDDTIKKLARALRSGNNERLTP